MQKIAKMDYPMCYLSRGLGHWLLICLIGLGWACENRYLKGEQLPPLPQADANSLAKRLDFMNQIIQQNSGEADYFYRRALIYLQIGKQNLALADIGSALKLDSGKYEYFYTQAKLLDLAKNHLGAFQAAKRAEQMGYSTPEFTWLLGKLSFLNQSDEQAEQYFLASRTLLGERAETFYYLGMIKKQANDTLNSASFLNRAIELQPAYPEAFKALVGIYEQSGEPKKAVRYAYRAVTNCPNNAQLYELYGKCLENIDETAEAIPWYEKAARLDPGLWLANHQLAMYHLRKEHYVTAATYLRSALVVKPTWDYGHAVLGWIYFEHLDNYPEALRHYEMAAKIKPGDPDLAARVARVQKRIAYEEYKKTPEGQAHIARKRREEAHRAADSLAQE